MPKIDLINSLQQKFRVDYEHDVTGADLVFEVRKTLVINVDNSDSVKLKLI